MSIEQKLENLRDKFSKDLSKVEVGEIKIDDLKVNYFGRKGKIAHLFSLLGDLSTDDRPKVGVLLNKLKNDLNNKFDSFTSNSKKNNQDVQDDCDYSLPGDPYLVGSIHPLTHILNEIEDILRELDFQALMDLK